MTIQPAAPARPAETRVIYLVERHPPHQPAVESPPTVLDKIKDIAALALVVLGLFILGGATVTLVGHVLGYIAIKAATAQMLFMTSIISIISGFHLAKGTPLSTEISGGPFALTI